MDNSDNAGVSAGRRILVVDDNADAAELLAAYLGLIGFQVTVANHPFEALQLAQQLQPDAYVLDIGLPGMDGISLATRLRAMPHARTATLIALTGHSQPAERRKGLEAGFDHYLLKPVDLPTLSAILSKTAARHQGSATAQAAG